MADRNSGLAAGGAGLSAPLAAVPLHTSGPSLEQIALRFLSAPIELHTPVVGQDRHPFRPLPYWPAMLSRDQLCDYLGVSWSTLKSILTVPPVDLGAKVIRYRRDQIDEWVKSRPPRQGGMLSTPEAAPPAPAAPDARLRALERARERAQGR